MSPSSCYFIFNQSHIIIIEEPSIEALQDKHEIHMKGQRDMHARDVLLDITTKDPLDKPCLVDCIKSIIALIDECQKVDVSSTKKVYNSLTFPSQAVYVSRTAVYIPEALINDRLQSISYMSLESFLEVMEGAKIGEVDVLPREYYKILNVITPITKFDENHLDCLMLRRSVVDFLKQIF